MADDPAALTSEDTPSKLARTAEIVRVLAGHLSVDWSKVALLDLPESIEPTDPDSLAGDLESLGPTFVKLGQLLSGRPDFVPQHYIDALSRLHHDVKPIGSDVVEEILERELGKPVDEAYASFDREPLASASLGQVHRATLREARAGEPPEDADPSATHETVVREVVVKVQRPDIRKTIVQDFEILEHIANALDTSLEFARQIGLPRIVDELRNALMRELDYRIEARSLERLGEILEDFERIEVPAPVSTHSTSRVLTMDFIEGEKVTSIGPEQYEQLDGVALGEELFSAYLDQVLVHGFFHADPHPGNVLVTPEGRLALIDLGMTGELSRGRREQLVKLMLAIVDARSEVVAEIFIEMGERGAHFDRLEFDRGIAHLLQGVQGAAIEELEFGRLMISMVNLAAESGLRLAPELSMLGKTLLQLDQAARALDPDFEPIAALRRHGRRIAGGQLFGGLAPESLVSAGIEVRELVQTLPKRINSVLGALAENRMTVRVDAIDEERLHATLRGAANRLAVSIVLAALILGAALMIQIDTPFKLFGYPAIALFLFLLAAACGFYLVFDVFRGERTRRKAGRRPGGTD